MQSDHEHPRAAHERRESDDQDQVMNEDEKLDEELEDSMDASDPPSSTRPDDDGNPVPSSGFEDSDA